MHPPSLINILHIVLLVSGGGADRNFQTFGGFHVWDKTSTNVNYFQCLVGWRLESKHALCCNFLVNVCTGESRLPWLICMSEAHYWMSLTPILNQTINYFYTYTALHCDITIRSFGQKWLTKHSWCRQRLTFLLLDVALLFQCYLFYLLVCLFVRPRDEPIQICIALPHTQLTITTQWV